MRLTMAASGEQHVCPIVDECNPRCATHLTLRNLLGAFAHCADRYCECPIYQELRASGASCLDVQPTATAFLVAS